jgi:hypothetical protein
LQSGAWFNRQKGSWLRPWLCLHEIRKGAEIPSSNPWERKVRNPLCWSSLCMRMHIRIRKYIYSYVLFCVCVYLCGYALVFLITTCYSWKLVMCLCSSLGECAWLCVYVHTSLYACAPTRRQTTYVSFVITEILKISLKPECWK